ncbi:Metal resistance protein YCF1, partial [Smittium culicis]
MFSSISIYNIIRHQIFQIPKVIFLLISSTSSFRRIKDYLATEEINQDCISYHNCDCDSNFDSENSSEFINCIDSDSGDTLNFKRSSVTVSDASLWWKYDPSSSSPTLNNISFSAKQGELVAVSGITGAGKSSLLISLLGEMYKSKGTIQINGKIAYTSQQPWLLNSTILENITFGNKVDHDFFQKVIRVCGLEDDLKSFADGELTVVGENGAKLSGGQRARVSIARAVYSRADLYLFDDPLAALDSKMAYSLFDKVFGQNGILKNRTRIISTNNISFLNRFDSVIVLQNGNIVEQGKVDELSKDHGILASMAKSFKYENNSMLDFSAHSKPSLENKQISTKIEECLLDNAEYFEKYSKFNYSSESLCSLSSEDSSNSIFITKNSVKKDKFKKSDCLDTDDSLVMTELTEKGKVNRKYQIQYFKILGVLPTTIFIAVVILAQYLMVYSTTVLKEWAEQNDKKFSGHISTYYLVVYLFLGVSIVVLSTLKTYIIQCISAISASKHYHERILSSVFNAPMSFFYKTPIGRILNRFSEDISVIDIQLHFSFSAWILVLFQIFFSFVSIVFELPEFLFIAIPMVIVYLKIQQIFIHVSRHLKRLESISKSPIYQHFKETLEGISTIRSYSQVKRFEDENLRILDLSQRTAYASLSLDRWLSIRLGFISNFLIFSISTFCLYSFYNNKTFSFINASTAGSVIIFAEAITANLDFLTKMYSKFETDSVSLERLSEYSNIEPEKEIDFDYECNNEKIDENWPKNGEIKFKNYSCSYSKDLPPALSNINLEIKAGEKLGIVGRTGAGKSSFALTLFRAIEELTGSITIDGVDIKSIELCKLRSRISIIPQDPSVFYGSVRFNLSPFDTTEDSREISDKEMWEALELVNLKCIVESMEGGLSANVLSGEN